MLVLFGGNRYDADKRALTRPVTRSMRKEPFPKRSYERLCALNLNDSSVVLGDAPSLRIRPT